MKNLSLFCRPVDASLAGSPQNAELSEHKQNKRQLIKSLFFALPSISLLRCGKALETKDLRKDRRFNPAEELLTSVAGGEEAGFIDGEGFALDGPSRSDLGAIIKRLFDVLQKGLTSQFEGWFNKLSEGQKQIINMLKQLLARNGGSNPSSPPRGGGCLTLLEVDRSTAVKGEENGECNTGNENDPLPELGKGNGNYHYPNRGIEDWGWRIDSTLTLRAGLDQRYFILSSGAMGGAIESRSLALGLRDHPIWSKLMLAVQSLDQEFADDFMIKVATPERHDGAAGLVLAELTLGAISIVVEVGQQISLEELKTMIRGSLQLAIGAAQAKSKDGKGGHDE